MKNWIKQNKILVTFNLAIFLCLAIIWILYALFGYQIIKAMYEGNSIAFLNSVIEGQKIHPLEHYLLAADGIMWACSSMVITLSILLTVLIKNLPLLQSMTSQDVSDALHDRLRAKERGASSEDPPKSAPGVLLSCLRDRQRLILILLLFIIVVSAIVWRPLLLFLFPGILLIHLNPWRQTYLAEYLISIVGTSMAFWIVSFWLLSYVKVSLIIFIYGVTLITVFLFGIGFWKHANRIMIVFDRQEAFVLLLLGAATALRVSLYWRWPLAPAGSDMSMHSYMAALILHHNSPPASHYPILPIDGFGAYAAGFQTLIALISLLGGAPIFRSALLMEAVTLAFLTFSFYIFLRAFLNRETSALASLLVSFLSKAPQSFITYGGFPTVLSLSFVIMSLALLWTLKARMSVVAWFTYAYLAAASTLTHLIPVVGSLYALVPVGAYVAMSGSTGSREEARTVVRNLLGIGLACAILLTPYLPNLLSTQVSPAEVEAIKEWQRHSSATWGGTMGGTIGNAIITIPMYLDAIYGWPFLVVGFHGLVALWLLRPRLGRASLIFSLAVIVLVINSMYWILPLSYAIHPDRTALLLLLPFLLGIASLIDATRMLFPRDVLTWTMAIVLLFVSVRQNEEHFYKTLAKWTAVTEADMKAMRWIEENTDPLDVFRNSEGDAGRWIPAIAFRPITNPHVNPFYFDEFKEASRRLNANYVYIGRKTIFGRPFSPEQFESQPDSYRKIYDSDGVVIYKSEGPASTGN